MFLEMSEILFSNKIRILHEHGVERIRTWKLESGLEFRSIDFEYLEFRLSLTKLYWLAL